jgi:hypothetical protein
MPKKEEQKKRRERNGNLTKEKKTLTFAVSSLTINHSSLSRVEPAKYPHDAERNLARRQGPCCRSRWRKRGDISRMPRPQRFPGDDTIVPRVGRL